MVLEVQGALHVALVSLHLDGGWVPFWVPCVKRAINKLCPEAGGQSCEGSD